MQQEDLPVPRHLLKQWQWLLKLTLGERGAAKLNNYRHLDTGLKSHLVKSTICTCTCTRMPLQQWQVKDVHAHCYCASLVYTLFIRHVCATSFSSARTKYRADDICINLVWEYFCWMLSDPRFFSGRSFPFLILSIIPKNKTIWTWEVLIIPHILFT